MNHNEKHKQLVAEFESGKLSQQEWEEELAYWTLMPDIWEEIRYRPQPSKPKKVIEFENLDNKEREKAILKTDIKNAVDSYDNQFSMVKSKNISDLSWLKEILGYLPKKDEINKNKIKNKIAYMESMGVL